MDLSKLAVVILNYRSSSDTIKLVHQLLEFSSDFKIIVVDNDSSDGSWEKLSAEFEKAALVDVIKANKNNGYSAGNNIGFRYAVQNYNVDAVGVMNPDIAIPQLSVLEIMYQRLFSCEKYGVIGGATVGIDGVYNPLASGWNIPTNRQLVENLYSGNKRTSRPVNYHLLANNLVEVDCVVGCFFLMKTELLLKMDYLDERIFLYNEENMLGIACKEHGYCEVIALDQFYYHNHDFTKHRTKTMQQRLAEAKINYGSRVQFCKLYYPRRLIPALFFVHLLNMAVICASCAVSKIRKR